MIRRILNRKVLERQLLGKRIRGRSSRGYMYVVEKAIQEVGAREGEVFDRSLWIIG